MSAHRSVASVAQSRRALAATARDTGRRALRRLPALALSIVALLALFIAAAHAEVPKLLPDGSFESEGALGIAVDQSSGDVYAAGFIDFQTSTFGHIDEFGAAGELLSPPSPLGGEGVYSSVAVDPADGDVYVLNAVSSEIGRYDSSSGALLESFTVPASENSYAGITTVVQIATDAAGNVYVPVVPANEVLEYSPSGALLRAFTGSGAGALKEPTGVAIDASGNLWVADTGNGRIEELSPSDAPLAEIPSEGAQAIALDPHGDVFAILHNSADPCGSVESPCDHLVEYSPAGTQLADLGAGDFGAKPELDLGGLSLDMLAVNDSSGRVYVTDAAKNRVWIFTPPLAPKLENELAVEVGSVEAKLGALVNPGGGDAAYRFEYGTTTAYGRSTPLPAGDTGAGFTARTVWAAASGLAPGTTYHYRVIVTSELGTIEGADQTFTTQTAAQANCPNEQLRTGFSASLPDCRAYELVTPPNKTSAEADSTSQKGNGQAAREEDLKANFAADDGDRLSFIGEDIFPGSPSAGQDYLATRGPSGWSTENEIPATNYYGYKCPESNDFIPAYSADMSKAVIAIGYDGECGDPEPELVSGEPRSAANLFLRDNRTGTYQLINLTPAGVTPASAQFESASSDLSHICFSEPAPLTPDALTGVENQYEWSAGAVRLVTASAPAECQSASGVSAPTLRSGYEPVEQESVSGFIAFESFKRLTGYNNIDANTGAPDPEIYLYDVADSSLVCASCNPSGQAPTGGATLESRSVVNGGHAPPRELTEGGRVFFDSPEALLPSDTNGQLDVYEFEPDGVGSCGAGAGCVFLISTGTSTLETWFIEASASGNDVFLREYQKLVPQDTQEEASTIYDARVDGGFPEPAVPPPCTTADACRAAPAPAPSIFGSPPSQTFAGAGNIIPSRVTSKRTTQKKIAKCRKGFRRNTKTGKCVKTRTSRKVKQAKRKGRHQS